MDFGLIALIFIIIVFITSFIIEEIKNKSLIDTKYLKLILLEQTISRYKFIYIWNIWNYYVNNK